MDALNIRPAEIEDARAIAEIQVRGWQTAYRGILPDERLDALDVEDGAAKRETMLADPSSPEIRNWILTEGATPVGWAASGPARDEDLDDGAHELYAIYLRPDRVGRGRGRALMQHCLADAVARGYAEMTMWVLTGNERAQRFYTAAGFAPDARVPQVPFADTGALKLRMVRLLAPTLRPPSA